jgi:hypothetical protein
MKNIKLYCLIGACNWFVIILKFYIFSSVTKAGGWGGGC